MSEAGYRTPGKPNAWRAVFQKASANPVQVQANPLPWLIAAARSASAQVGRADLRES